MNIVVAGGSGFIGRALCRSLIADGHYVAVLSRYPGKAARLLDPAATVIEWDAATPGTWEHSLDGVDAVINLAGEPIAEKRWTEPRKAALRDSRIRTTRLLIDALSHSHRMPRLFINASGIGFYGPQEGAVRVTESSPSGSGFLADLCVAWEGEAARAEALGLRVVRLRTGMVLGMDGGALPRMITPFRLFIGGPVMPGTQWISWIHLQDHVGLIQRALADPRLSGPVNAVSPEPVTMREFCRILGRTLGRPSWLPVPSFALHAVFGELATALTTGQRVEPTVALHNGYAYRYPALDAALANLILSSGFQ